MQTLNLNSIPRSRTTNLLPILIGLIFTFNALKGLRLPNIWAFTHYRFSYEFGFVKRGFIGQIVNLTNVKSLTSYEAFVVFSFFILGFALFGLFNLVMKLILKKDRDSILVALVFSTSPSLVYCVHTVGYPDIVGIAVTIFVITRRSLEFSYCTAFVASIICMLIHESFLIIFFPIIFMHLLLNSRFNIKKITTLVFYSAGMIALGFFMSRSTLPQAVVNEAYRTLQLQTPFPVREDAFAVQYWTTMDNLKIMLAIWSRGVRWAYFLASCSVTIPTAALFAYFTIRKTKEFGFNGIQKWLALAASFSPFLMHFIAWDMERFNSLVILTSFLIFVVVLNARALQTRVAPKSTDHQIAAIAIFLSVLNFGSNQILFDGYRTIFFPYIETLTTMTKSLSGQKSGFQIPKQ